MKNDLEISIIIPAFNAENYIERCLSSILNSGADKDSYEIIAVDDSSTDRTLDILKKMATETPQLKVYFRHKSGPGGARNQGLNHAKGRYVMFVDIDDHIDSKNFAHLVNTLLPLYEQDIIGIDYVKVDESGNISPYNNKLFPYCKDISGSEYMSTQIPESVLWGYIFRRKFIIDNNLKFIEKNIFDHEEFVAKAFCLAQNLVFLPTLIYYFHYNIKESLSNIDNPQHQERLVADRVSIITELQKFGFLLGDPMSEAGLERKLKFISAALISRIILSNYEEEFICGTVKELESCGLYPLPKETEYGFRYRVFRRVTDTQRKILWWKQYKKAPFIEPMVRYIFG